VAEHAEITHSVGYLSQRFSLYGDLSIDENIAFFAEIHGLWKYQERRTRLLELTQLLPFRNRLAERLSGGMKQKLALCCALVHRPEILFLDEPTTGVDAVSRREFWELLDRLKATGLTIVVSTPYMDEADRCGRVALIQRGRILGVDAPGRIAASFGKPLFTVHAAERYPLLLATREYEHAATVFPFGDTLHYTDRRDGVQPDEIAVGLRDYLQRRGFADVGEIERQMVIALVFDLRRASRDAEHRPAALYELACDRGADAGTRSRHEDKSFAHKSSLILARTLLPEIFNSPTAIGNEKRRGPALPGFT
jgi:ABC-type multidrug transport system ATPase subunit